MSKNVLTSVKVDDTTFDAFKIECVKRKFSLNKLVNAALYLYITDDDFREKVTLTSLRADFNINQ
jgi:hypothetical protein